MFQKQEWHQKIAGYRPQRDKPFDQSPAQSFLAADVLPPFFYASMWKNIAVLDSFHH
jgi:hypothetical protein